MLQGKTGVVLGRLGSFETDTRQGRGNRPTGKKHEGMYDEEGPNEKAA